MSKHPLRYSIHTQLREFHLRKLLQSAPKGRMLDVGCGLGYLTQTFGPDFETAVGLEYDFASLELNAERGLLNMVRGSAYDLPFADGSFDVVLCSELLEHLPDGCDAKAIHEMGRVLRPGGRLLITVPSLHGLRAYSALRNLGHTDPSGGEYHYRIGYDKAVMTDMIKSSGTLRVRSLRHSMFLISELFMDLLKWVYFRKNKLKEHSDIMQANNSLTFKIYRSIFPILNAVFRVEDRIFCSWLDGHIMIVEAERG